MISNFSDAALSADLALPIRLPGNRYLIRGRPHRPACFFEQTELERLFRHDFLQIARFTAQILHLVGVCSACCIASQPPFSGPHEVFRPFVVDALGNALTPAQFSNAVLAPQAIQHDADLLFGRIMFAGYPFDVFDDLLARTLACSSCLSDLPLLSGYDEPKTLSYQIRLLGPISADVKHGCSVFSDVVYETASTVLHQLRLINEQSLIHDVVLLTALYH